MYVVKFKAKKAVADHVSPPTTLTEEDTEHWVTIDREGWVPATSQRVNAVMDKDYPSSNCKTFETIEEAAKFMSTWGGHPWYSVPKSWEIIPVQVKYKQVWDGYEVIK